jgi:hypothetical protein
MHDQQSMAFLNLESSLSGVKRANPNFTVDLLECDYVASQFELLVAGVVVVVMCYEHVILLYVRLCGSRKGQFARIIECCFSRASPGECTERSPRFKSRPKPSQCLFGKMKERNAGKQQLRQNLEWRENRIHCQSD